MTTCSCHLAAPDTYAAALAAFQSEIPRIRKDAAAIVEGENKAGKRFTYGYKYADLASITAEGMTLLGKHGLSFTSFPRLSDNGFVLHYHLRHSSGEGDEGDWPLPDPIRTKPQTVGSAITYARRYAFCAATGIAPDDEDDDGQDASDGERKPYQPETRADGSATDAELERMNRGPVRGVERTKQADPDDPFYDTPARDQPPREELPGTGTREQMNRMHALFGQLGFDKDARDERLKLTREIVGRDVASASALSFVEAQKLNTALAERAKTQKAATDD